MEKLLLLIGLLKLFSLEVIADIRLPKPPYCGKSNLSSSEARVFDGDITRIDEYPWMGRLQSKYEILGEEPKKSTCTSSLITSNWVLTAAHCVFNASVDLSPSFVYRFTVVTLGEWDIYNDPDCTKKNVCAPKSVTSAAVEFVHPKFYKPRSGYKVSYDIALLRLERNVNFSPFIQRSCLPLESFAETLPSYEGRQVVITGWGRYDIKESGSQFKRKATGTVSDHEPCLEDYGRFSEEYQICVGGTATGACKGDSGGPLLLQSSNDENTFYQIGVASLGRQECVNNSKSTVYVRVDAFIDWIRETIQQYDIDGDNGDSDSDVDGDSDSDGDGDDV